MSLATFDPRHFDSIGRQMRQAPGFPHFCIDGFLDAAFAAEVHDAFPSWQDAREMGHSFDAVNEKRKIQVCDAALFAPPVLRLHRMLADPEFVHRLSEASGIPGLIADPSLAGGGIHETNGGGRLDVHVDFNFNEGLGLYRRLNILVYFNQRWRSEWGGELDLWDADVQRCLGRFEPLFNRAAGFATSEISWHGVRPVECPPGRTRKSFAVYYYTKEPPPGWDGVRHSTIFRARPDEKLRGALLMPAESAMRRARRTVRAVGSKVKGLVAG
jgi:hypothetical protein